MAKKKDVIKRNEFGCPVGIQLKPADQAVMINAQRRADEKGKIPADLIAIAKKHFMEAYPETDALEDSE